MTKPATKAKSTSSDFATTRSRRPFSNRETKITIYLILHGMQSACLAKRRFGWLSHKRNRCFVVLRSAMVRNTRMPLSALVLPVGESSSRAGRCTAAPLHTLTTRRDKSDKAVLATQRRKAVIAPTKNPKNGHPQLQSHPNLPRTPVRVPRTPASALEEVWAERAKSFDRLTGLLVAPCCRVCT
jgi:hypothetical protein